MIFVASQKLRLDGLYVLLKPDKKCKTTSSAKTDSTSNRSKVPPHLLKYVMQDFPPETCTWGLSGPQFPKPTAIQQRYCYPRGNPEYSCLKGGALWTMYDSDGQESTDFRLLHVYFSTKRAGNNGMKIPDEELQAAERAGKALRSKKSPRQSKKCLTGTRARKKRNVGAGRRPVLPLCKRFPHQQRLIHESTSPLSGTSQDTTLTNTSSSRSSICTSPISFDLAVPVASPNKKAKAARPRGRPRKGSTKILKSHNNLVSPNTAITVTESGPERFKQALQHGHHTFHNPQYRYPMQQLHGNPFGRNFHPIPSFDNDISIGSVSENTINANSFVLMSQQHRPKSSATASANQSKAGEDIDVDKETNTEEKEEPYPCNMDESFHTDEDPMFNDHLHTLTMNPSMDSGDNIPSSIIHSNNLTQQICQDFSGPMSMQEFSQKLHALHQRLRETILISPPHHHPALIGTLANWAKLIFVSPLDDFSAVDLLNDFVDNNVKSDMEYELEDTNDESKAEKGISELTSELEV